MCFKNSIPAYTLDMLPCFKNNIRNLTKKYHICSHYYNQDTDRYIIKTPPYHFLIPSSPIYPGSDNNYSFTITATVLFSNSHTSEIILYRIIWYLLLSFNIPLKFTQNCYAPLMTVQYYTVLLYYNLKTNN